MISCEKEGFVLIWQGSKRTIFAALKPIALQVHGLKLNQEWASFKVPCISELRSNQVRAYLMVCEEVTDSYVRGGWLTGPHDSSGSS